MLSCLLPRSCTHSRRGAWNHIRVEALGTTYACPLRLMRWGSQSCAMASAMVQLFVQWQPDALARHVGYCTNACRG
eukprot:15469139-Alexandrium_andersonii.AAC.2